MSYTMNTPKRESRWHFGARMLEISRSRALRALKVAGSLHLEQNLITYSVRFNHIHFYHEMVMISKKSAKEFCSCSFFARRRHVDTHLLVRYPSIQLLFVVFRWRLSSRDSNTHPDVEGCTTTDCFPELLSPG